MNDFVEILKMMIGIGWLFPSGKPVREHALLNIIATAYKDQENLAQLLHDYAEHFWGSRKENIHLLANMFETGVPLDLVMNSVAARKLFSEDTCRIISIAYQLGTVETAITWRSQQMEEISHKPVYVVWFILWIETFYFITMTSGIMIFIIPKYKEIFDGFDIEMPGITKFMIDCATFFARHWYLFFTPVLLYFANLFFKRFFLYYTFRILKIDTAYLDVFYRFNDQKRIVLLNLLADAVEANEPIEPVLNSWYLTETSKRARHYLEVIKNDFQQGISLAYALGKNKFLNQRELNLIDSAQRVGNLAWMLRFVANEYLQKIKQKQNFWHRFCYWMIFTVLAFSSLVVATGMFIPLIKMISELS